MQKIPPGEPTCCLMLAIRMASRRFSETVLLVFQEIQNFLNQMEVVFTTHEIIVLDNIQQKRCRRFNGFDGQFLQGSPHGINGVFA